MLKKLLIIFLYVVCIVSCTKETTIYNTIDNEEDEVTYTIGELSVHLENSDVTTRSGWTHDDYFPENDIMSSEGKTERGLFNFTLISFNSDMLLEYHTNQTTALNFYPPAMDNLAKEGNTDFYATPMGLQGVTLTTGAHYFYAICNQSKEMSEELGYWLDTNQGTLSKDEFEKWELKYPIDTLVHKFPDYVTSDDRLHSGQRCMMVNIVSPAPNYMASLDNSSQIPPKANFIRTNIGKLFAKVSLAYIPENDSHDKLTEVVYRVINVPNNCYLMPNIFNGQVETPFYKEDYQASAEYTSCFYNYYTRWFDQKYSINRIKIEDGIPVDSDCGNDDGNLDDGVDDYQGWQNASTKTEKTHLYCMENGNKTPLQGNSTFLLVKARYNPEKWVDQDGNEVATPSTDGTFWRIKRAASYDPEYYCEKPKTAQVGSGTIVEYGQGFTYYTIWLQTDGIYQVKRNAYYKIALTQVLSAGAANLSSVIDPEAPIETETRSGGNNASELTNGIRWIQGNI